MYRVISFAIIPFGLWAYAACPQLSAIAEEIRMEAVRLPLNPIITTASSPTLGNKVNGPSVIRVPEWIENRLGKYYLYFAHHKGDFIRLAYADRIEGPWKIYEPGTLRLSQATLFNTHIASPDVHVDSHDRTIRMYFHGSRETENQKTGVAVSTDGIRFDVRPVILGEAYFRVFQHADYYYAIDNKGQLNRSRYPDREWEVREFPLIAPITVDDQYGLRTDVRIRHAAVLVMGSQLLICYTRKSDAPERILSTTVDLLDDWNDWTASPAVEVLRPEEEYEGIGYPITLSKKGGAVEVQQLRDPYLFAENGTVHLFYSVGGEMGIAIARVNLHSSPKR